METKKDALGNDIILGELYGVSVDNNGVTYTTVGEAIRITKTGMCTLKPIIQKTALWMDDAKDIQKEKISKTITVKPVKLFPVDKNLIIKATFYQ